MKQSAIIRMTRTAALGAIAAFALFSAGCASAGDSGENSDAAVTSSQSSNGTGILPEKFAAESGGGSTVVLPAPTAAEAAAQIETDTSVASIWADPTFKRQFVGSYGVNAEVEPRLLPDEVASLEKVRPFMGTDLAKAETMLKEIVKPQSSATLDFTLAGVQFQQDRMADALANYRSAVAKFPSFRRAWRNIGLINVRTGDYAAAIPAFTKMIELGGGDAFSYGLLGVAYAAKEDYQAAEAAYRSALLLQPDNTEWRFGLTRCVFKQEKFEDAAALLDVLIERYPDNAQFWLLQAHTRLGLKQSLKAAENLEVVDQLGKSTVDTLHTLGDIYVTENLPDLAVSAYVRAIRIDPAQSASRPIRSAEALAGRGAFEQSRLVAKEIHSVFEKTMPDGDRRRLLKVEAKLSMAEGAGGDETVLLLEEIVKLDPLDGEALMLLGQHYEKKSEPDRAIFYYERAASVDAFEAEAKVRHAKVLVGLNRHTDAVPLLRRAQEIKPRDNVARYLEQVERLAKSRR